MAKFCSNCGTPYEEGTAFCANCGANLAAPAVRKAPKSAITVAGLRDIAAKRAKAMMIIVLVVSLLIGLATVTGSIDVIGKAKYDGKLQHAESMDAREAYIKTGEDKIDAISTTAKVLNIIYGITLLGVAALTILSMLENACGGKADKLFKIGLLAAAGATLLYIMLHVLLGTKINFADYDKVRTFFIAVPTMAWVNLVAFAGMTVLKWIPNKKKA